MAMYGIHRIEKRCRCDVYGLQQEANRTVQDHLKGKDFKGSDIDWLKTKENIYLVHCSNWNKKISETLQQKNIKTRKNSIVLIDAIYTASAEFFEDKSKEEILDYFKGCLEFHEKAYGTYTINAVIHFDEVRRGQEQGLKYGNLHLHIASIPIIDKPDGSASLSARDLMGNKTNYRKRQDDFFEQVSSLWGLERGEVKDYGETRKHINKMEYEAQEAQKKAQKAKAELNIRQRVQEACASQSEPITIIKRTEHKLTKAPDTITITASDFERLQSQVSCSADLKSGLKELEKLAKETLEASAIDEKVIKANQERDQEKERTTQLEIKIKEQQHKNQEQQSYIKQLSDYITKLENLLSITKDWLKKRKIYKEFQNFLENQEQEPKEREHEYTEHER